MFRVFLILMMEVAYEEGSIVGTIIYIGTVFINIKRTVQGIIKDTA